MRERTAYQVPSGPRRSSKHLRIDVLENQYRVSRCKYHAPDPNPNTNRNPSPKYYGDVYMSMQSTWYAVLSCITVKTFLLVVICGSARNTIYIYRTVPRVIDDGMYHPLLLATRDRSTQQQYRHGYPQRLPEVRLRFTPCFALCKVRVGMRVHRHTVRER